MPGNDSKDALIVKKHLKIPQVCARKQENALNTTRYRAISQVWFADRLLNYFT
jgi:hypothetical protein